MSDTYLKYILSILLSCTVLGCGGGSEPDLAAALGGDVKVNLDSIAARASQNYTGASHSAVIDVQAANNFLSEIVYGFQDQFINSNNRSSGDLSAYSDLSDKVDVGGITTRNSPQVNSCEDGGSVTVFEQITNGDRPSLAFNYQNCVESGRTRDGRLLVEPVTLTDSGDLYNYNLFFDNIRVSTAKGSYSLDGTQQHRQRTTCGGYSVADELYTDTVSGYQVRYDQFRVDYVSGETCDTNFPLRTDDVLDLPAKLEGTIWVSSHGAAHVTTPIDLYFSTARKLDDSVTPLVARYGSIEVKAIDGGSRLNLTYEPIGYEANNYDVSFGPQHEVLASLQIHDNSDALLLDVVQAYSLVQEGGLSDIEDSDGDGIINSVERIYDLDPNDVADGSADSDGDGFSNIYEISRLSNPASIQDAGLSSNLSVQLTSEPLDLGDSPLAVEVQVALANLHTTFSAGESHLELAIIGDADWNANRISTSSHTCQVTDKLITCELRERTERDIDTEDRPLRFVFWTDNIESVGVSAELINLPFDIDDSNNSQELQFSSNGLNQSQNIADVELVVTAPPSALILTENETADQPLLVSVSNPSEEWVGLVELSASMPADVSVTNLDPNCELAGSVLTCQAPTLSPSGSVEFSNLINAGDGFNSSTIEWKATTLSARAESVEFVSQTLVEQASSLAGIQLMIDQAANGDQILIPPGRYIGELNFAGKYLHLTGASAGQTELINMVNCGPIIRAATPGTIIENISFKTSGEVVHLDTNKMPSGNRKFHINDNIFEPAESNVSCPTASLIRDSKVDRTYWHSLFINNNIFRDYGSSLNGSKNICYHLIDATLIQQTMIYQNHFIDLDCDAAILVNTNYARRAGPNSIQIVNNTFVNTRSPIHLENGENHGVINIANNLFLRSPNMISVSPKFSSQLGYFGNTPEDSFLVANWYKNLVFDFDFPASPLPFDVHWNFNVIEGPLEFNPQVETRDNGTVVPAPGSPIIDAGMSLGIFSNQGSSYDRWTPDWVIDGDEDGVSLPDFGAIEFLP